MLIYDFPVLWLDSLFARGSPPGLTRPSLWLRAGDGVMALSIAQTLILTRQYGDVMTKRIVLSASIVTLAVISWFLITSFHELVPADMPDLRFILSIGIGWMAGHFIAIDIYSLKRGRVWWQAPFYACIFAFAVQSFLFFLINFFGRTPAIWIHWFVIDCMFKFCYTLIFIMFYWYIRTDIKPAPGYGN